MDSDFASNFFPLSFLQFKQPKLYLSIFASNKLYFKADSLAEIL
jgi:hypothetical protein